MNDDLIEENKEKKKAPPGKGEKFFFDMNFFEEDGEVEEEVEEEPPPPVFSEEELDAAKQTAFIEGKNEGLKEATESREQFVAALLERIIQSSHVLFEAEIEREKTFERESVALCLQIFEKLFPFYNEKHGFQELQHALSDVLAGEDGKSAILIELHPDYVSDIQSHIESAAAQSPSNCQYDFQGNAHFDTMQFRLSWKDGGAVRDSDTLSSQIRDILQEALSRDSAQDAVPSPSDGAEQVETEIPVSEDADNIKDVEHIEEEIETAAIQDPATEDGETIDE